jgi:Urocanase Rossmann-like domain
MPLEPLSSATFAFIAQVEEACATLLCPAAPSEACSNEASLGGKLLYAGHLDEPGRAFIIAANIAGAATLAASADPATAKQAMREGTVDFLVNSLDEALRVLKNQLRKRETVAVCVSLAPALLEAEMRSRGVVPDLSFSPDFPGAGAHWEQLRSAFARGQEPGVASIHAQPAVPAAQLKRLDAEEGAAQAEEEKTWLTWRVSDSPALWLPKLDALALGALSPEAQRARLWLKRAPRYLGRLAQNARTLRVTQQQAGKILARFGVAEIGVPIEITLGPWGNSPA